MGTQMPHLFPEPCYCTGISQLCANRSSCFPESFHPPQVALAQGHNPLLCLSGNLPLTEGPFWPRYKVAPQTFPLAPSNDHLQSSRFTREPLLRSSGHSHLALAVRLLPKRHTSSTKPTSASMHKTQLSSPGSSYKTLRHQRLGGRTKGFAPCPCFPSIG